MKQHGYKLLLFDMDGVLVESSSTYIDVHYHILTNKFSVPVTRKEIWKQMGVRDEEFYRNFLPENKISEACQLLKNLLQEDKYTKNVMLIPGVQEALLHLQDFMRAIVTNSRLFFARKVLSNFAIDRYFNRILAADHSFSSKEERCREAIADFAVDEKKTLLIGDLPSDVETANKVGCYSCLVFNEYSWLYPDLKSARACEPTYIIDDIRQLKDIVRAEDD